MPLPSLLQIGRNLRTVSVVGGTPMPAKAQRTEVAQVQQKMVSQGMLPQASGHPGDGESLSLEVLSALNLTVDNTTGRTFSLLTTETDTEVIENPNIIDTIKWEETMNENILTTRSFPAAADNFFTVDAGPDEATKKQREKVEKTKDKKDLTNFAGDLLTYNIADPTRPRLPQFKR